eukprot:4569964-Amphidinium_carterae.1
MEKDGKSGKNWEKNELKVMMVLIGASSVCKCSLLVNSDVAVWHELSRRQTSTHQQGCGAVY